MRVKPFCFMIKCYQKALELTIWFISFVSSMCRVSEVFLVNLYAVDFLWILNCPHNYCEPRWTKVSKGEPRWTANPLNNHQLPVWFSRVYLRFLYSLLLKPCFISLLSSYYRVIPHNPITKIPKSFFINSV